jgi:enediyne biosynthesis protein E4
MKAGPVVVAGVIRLATQMLDGQTSPPARPFPTFENVTTKTGIDFQLDAGNSAQWLILESNSAGVVVIDYDNDGWPDLYFINGSTIERFEKHEKSRGNRLYHNNHDGTFTDVTSKAGVAGNGAWGMGGCIGDVDHNGFDDILVTNVGPDVLYLNNGDGTFRDASVVAGIQGGERWHSGCAFGDYDGDGDLDLYVSNYVQFDLAQARQIPDYQASRLPGARSIVLGPQVYKPTPHEFYENVGGGRFKDTSVKLAAGDGRPRGTAPTAAAGKGFGVVWADYDNDGDPDIFVANDRMPNFLFRNNGDKTFTEVAVPAGVAVDASGSPLAWMGVDMADFNGDGWLDLVVTTFSGEHTTLFRNNQDGTFTDVSRRVGLPPSLMMGWGTQFVDFDLDGRLDLINVNGHVSPDLDEGSKRLIFVGYRQRPTIFRQQPDGSLRELGLTLHGPFEEGHVGRGLAVADLNNDGQMDLVIANQDERPSILMNRGVTGQWLLVKLKGTKSNTSAIGARVTVRAGGRTQIREVKSGGSYLSQSDLRQHFGLGDATVIDELMVRWPSGRVQTRTQIRPNQILEISE